MSESCAMAVTCPDCGSEQAFTAWQSVTANLDPHLKSKLVNGELHTMECVRCGYVGYVPADTLYLDADKTLAVWLQHPDGNGRCGVMEISVSDVSRVMQNNHTLRVVPRFDLLMEKIRIFDDGYDDFTIELIKLMLTWRCKLDIDVDLIYSGRRRPWFQGTKLDFVYREEGGFTPIDVPAGPAIKNMEPILDALDWTHSHSDTDWVFVDRRFVLRELEHRGLADELRPG